MNVPCLIEVNVFFLLLQGTYPPGLKNISLWKKIFFIFFFRGGLRSPLTPLIKGGNKVSVRRVWSVESGENITYKL